MARVDGYVPSPWRRPAFAADGVVVARRAIVLDRPYEGGEVIEGIDERMLVILQRNHLVDTLPAGTPVVGAKPPAPPPPPAKPQPKAAHPRGR